MGPMPFTVERRADGCEGTVNGDREHQRAGFMRCNKEEKGTLHRDSKGWSEERGGKEVETRDPRPERGQRREKLPGFPELSYSYFIILNCL